MSLAYSGHQLLHPGSLEAILRRLGMWDDCVHVVDFGDERCYSGAQQNVRDIGHEGRVYTRGVNLTATTDDPSFVGVAGSFRQADSTTDFTNPPHFSFDGGDWLFSGSISQGGGSNAAMGQRTAFLCNQLKKFSLFSVVATSTGSIRSLFGTGNDNGGVGSIRIGYDSAGAPRYLYGPDNMNSNGVTGAAGDHTANTWECLCASHDEGGGATGSFVRCGGSVTDGDGNSGSSDSTGMINHWSIGAFAGGTDGANVVQFMAATTRVMMCAFFDRYVHKQEWENLIRELRQWRVVGLA